MTLYLIILIALGVAGPVLLLMMRDWDEKQLEALVAPEDLYLLEQYRSATAERDQHLGVKE